MAGSWSIEETKALIAVWGARRAFRTSLKGSTRIATSTSESLWNWRTMDMINRGNCVGTKIKNLTQRYRKVFY